MQADGSEQTLVSGTGGGNAPAWSPDGRTIAFTSDRTGNDSIYAMNADGGNVRRLTIDDHHNDNAMWSPDGKQIVFSSNRDGNNEIYVMNADGSGATNLTNNPALIHDVPAWSPDGRMISFTAVGHDPRPFWLTQSLGVSSILLQSALLMGLVCLLLRRWRLPFGALTLIITLNSLFMVVLRDRYILLPAALGTGLVADLLLISLQPSSARPRRSHVFAFTAPVVLYGLYFLTLFATAGVTWSITLIGGSVVVAGIVGLLVSFLLVPPTVSSSPA
jgi:TolB protein